MSNIDEDDEDVEVLSRHGRWVEPRLPGTFGSAFRGVPLGPHGGTQAVKDEDTLGAITDCWCGLPYEHDWPGKAQGRKHPKEQEMPNTDQAIDRSDLRAFSKAVADFILHEVRVNGLPYRLTNNGVLLYPLDGTPPVNVYARSTDRQIKSLAAWHAKHVQPRLEEPQAPLEAQVQKLAATINDPIEHPVEVKAVPIPVEVETEAPVAPEPAPVAEGHPLNTDPTPQDYGLSNVWSWHVGREGDVIEGIATNGVEWMCVLCKDTNHPYVKDNTRGIGGHRRIWHVDGAQEYLRELQKKGNEARKMKNLPGSPGNTRGDSTPLRRPEVIAKSGQTRTIRSHQLKAVKAAIIGMCESLEWYPLNPAAVTQPANLDLQADVDRLSADLAVAVTRAENAEARLALMQEAFQGLK